MAKDSLQPTWKKTLSGVVTAIGVDNNGTVWAGDGAGKISRFTSDGISSEPIYLDNPICSISVDKSTNDIYVGDLANNVYKYTASGERKWGKNLGTGSIDAISIISTINNTLPDNKGNFDLTSLYYSQEQINALLAPLGKTKSVNGNIPNDAGNITVDLSGYYSYKGALNDDSDLDKDLATGWYALHSSDGSTSILLVYADKNVSGLQVRIATDKSISVRYKKDDKYTDWAILTNNVQSINNIKPDKDGNVDLDLTGNIKTVNRIKPDKNGNIQLGAGSINSVKSVNKKYVPDDTGNVQLPNFALNLLPNTSSKSKELKPADDFESIDSNLWSKQQSAIENRQTLGDISENEFGEQIATDVAVVGNNTYSLGAFVTTLPDTVYLGENAPKNYSLWRQPKVTFTIVCRDSAGKIIPEGVFNYKYHLKQQKNSDMGMIFESFNTPANAASVSFWYNGLERTDDNVVLGEKDSTIPFSSYVNDQDQSVDLAPMYLAESIKDKDITVRLQVNVTNYKKGSFFTLKTKDLDGADFLIDSSKLDSDKRLLKPTTAIDTSKLVTGNGFYTWDYKFPADELVNIEDNIITPVTNIIGNLDYTIKIVVNDSADSNPDMNWTVAPEKDAAGKVHYGSSAFNKIEFIAALLTEANRNSVFELGTYSLDNNDFGVSGSVGKYSATVNVDLNDSAGYCRLYLFNTNANDSNTNQEHSSYLPIIDVDDTGKVKYTKRGKLTVDGLTVDKIAKGDRLRVVLGTMGQTKPININEVKLSKWVDDDTPPDMNWLPNLNDIGKVQTVNNVLPDSTGNIILHGIDNPDYDYGANDTFDVDKATQTGVYRFMDSKVIASIKPEALNGLYTTQGGTSMCGYLFVLNHDNFNREQIIFLNHGSVAQDTQIATRSISGTNNWRGVFKPLLNTDDYVNTQSYVRDLSFMNDDAGRNIYNSNIDMEKFATVGITHFLGCKITSGYTIPHFDDYNNKYCYGWIINIPHWKGAGEYDTLLYIAGDSTTSYRPALYIRSCYNNITFGSWEKIPTSRDLKIDIDSSIAKINTFSNPTVINGYVFDQKWLDSLHENGIYYVDLPFKIDSDELTQLSFSTADPLYLFNHVSTANTSVTETIVQVFDSNINILSRKGHIDSTGKVVRFSKWYSTANDIAGIKNDLGNFKEAVNDKIASMNIVKYAASEEEAVNHSRQTRGIFYYWY